MNELFKVKPTRQLEMYRQELAKLQRAGLEGKAARRLALKLAGDKYKHQSGGSGREQLSWRFGRGDLKGQQYLKLRGGENNKKVVAVPGNINDEEDWANWLHKKKRSKDHDRI